MARRLRHRIRAAAPRILKAATNGSCARCGVPRWSDPARRVAGVSGGRVACPLRAARRAAPIGSVQLDARRRRRPVASGPAARAAGCGARARLAAAAIPSCSRCAQPRRARGRGAVASERRAPAVRRRRAGPGAELIGIAEQKTRCGAEAHRDDRSAGRPAVHGDAKGEQSPVRYRVTPSAPTRSSSKDLVTGSYAPPRPKVSSFTDFDRGGFRAAPRQRSRPPIRSARSDRG